MVSVLELFPATMAPPAAVAVSLPVSTETMVSRVPVPASMSPMVMALPLAAEKTSSWSSSTVWAPGRELTGGSFTGVTVTSRIAVVVAVSPLAASCEVAATVSWKSVSLSAGGVIVRPASWAGVSVHTPPPWWVPADRAAPAGTPEMVIEVMLSEPSVSASAAPMFSAMAESSLPAAGGVVTVGASATALTVTPRLPEAVAASVGSAVLIAVTVPFSAPRSRSESVGGVRCSSPA